MKTHAYDIPLILKLANGKSIVEEIEHRCQLAGKSMRELCRDSEVSSATLSRMKKAKHVSNLRPLTKIERVFERWAKS